MLDVRSLQTQITPKYASIPPELPTLDFAPEPWPDIFTHISHTLVPVTPNTHQLLAYIQSAADIMSL